MRLSQKSRQPHDGCNLRFRLEKAAYIFMLGLQPAWLIFKLLPNALRWAEINWTFSPKREIDSRAQKGEIGLARKILRQGKRTNIR